MAGVLTRRVSLSELAADGIHLRPAEAAAVVAELCRQHARGESPGIPSPGIIRITSDGRVVAQGPIPREQAGVARAAHLLSDLIPDTDAPSAYRAGGGLRLVIARALGILDLPPYSSLDEFRAALVRFAGPDPVATTRGLFQRWERPVSALPPVTPSPLRPQAMASIAVPVPGRDRSGPLSSALGLVVAALLAVGAIAIVVGSAQLDRTAQAETPVRATAAEANHLNIQPPLAAPQRAVATAPAPVRKVRPVAAPVPAAKASAARPSATRPSARRAPQPREAGLERRRGAAAKPRPGAAPKPRPSFFNRELFRIVIK